MGFLAKGSAACLLTGGETGVAHHRIVRVHFCPSTEVEGQPFIYFSTPLEYTDVSDISKILYVCVHCEYLNKIFL